MSAIPTPPVPQPASLDPMLRFGSSLFLGEAGHYRLLGLEIVFLKESPEGIHDLLQIKGAEGPILTRLRELAKSCFKSCAFQIATLGYLHVFMHESGHALACRYFTKESCAIEIYQEGGGRTKFPVSLHATTPMAHSIIDAAGPLANMLFSGGLLLSSTLFQWPIALCIKGGAFLWMTGEMLYMYTSSSNRDEGDFGLIANRDSFHHLAAKSAMIGFYALNVIKYAF